MFAWLINKVAAPVLPILGQAYVVVSIVDFVLKEILSKMHETDSKLYNNIKSIESAASAVKAALVKIIVALGGVLPLVAQSEMDLTCEVQKLRKML